MVTWNQLCGEDFVIWKGSHFGRCFLHLLFVVTHSLLAVTSGFYVGLRKTPVRDQQLLLLLPATLRTRLRKACCTVLLISPVAFLVLSQMILGEQLSPLAYVSLCSVVTCWLVHFFYLQTLSNPLSIDRRSLGELPVVLLVLLCGITTVLQISALLTDPPSTSRRGELYSLVASAVAAAFYLVCAVRLSSTSSTPRRDTETDAAHSYVRFVVGDDVSALGTAEECNCLSRLTFWWAGRLMRRGYRGQLNDPEDLHELPLALRPEEVALHVQKESPGATSLVHLLFRCFGAEYCVVGTLKLGADALLFAGPILLNKLVLYLEERTGRAWEGYVYATALAVACLLGTLLSTHYNYGVARVGLKVRAAIVALVYGKTVSIQVRALKGSAGGKATNLMTTDTDRIANVCPSFHEAWSLPVQVAVTLFLLYQQVGVAFLAGLAIAVLLVPVNRWLALRIGALSEAMMSEKDARIRLVSEILRGMRMIKMQAWESLFGSRVVRVRNRELGYLRQRKYLDAVCVFFWVTTPVLVSVLTFVTYALLGHKLTAAKVFTCLALFTLLKVPLNAFPWVLNGLMEAWVSLKRTQQFLDLPDFEPGTYYADSAGTGDSVAAKITSGVFHWGADDDVQLPAPISAAQNGARFFLGPVNVTLLQGKLVGVVGRVGSGKSTLISALLGEAARFQGAVYLGGQHGVGLVPQEPWLQRGTLRSNVLFGKPFEAPRYQRTLECCALVEDVKAMPLGDLTEVGEDGQTLSGGQKCRVCLARAVYQDFELYLFDDPLSALDAHVAEQVFERCILGALGSKTRLLCTHQVGFLSRADHVLVLRDGRVVASGPPSAVLEPALGDVLQEPRSPSSPSAGKTDPWGRRRASEEKQTMENTVPALVEAEAREVGAVRWSTVRSYGDAVGFWLALAVLLSIALMQVSRTSADWWLAAWVSHINTTSNGSTGESKFFTIPADQDPLALFLTVYGGIAVGNGILTLIRAFLFAYGGLVAAAKVHGLLLTRILEAPLSFFEATPVGRVLNRFSTDVCAIDDSLPFVLNILLAQGAGLVGVLSVTTYGLPWSLLLLVPLAFAYHSIQQYYRWTSRELKRLGSVTLSPIYSHFSETLAGLSVIRSFGAAARFCQENLHKLSVNQQAVFASLAASQWLGLRLQLMGVALTSGVAFLAVVQHHIRGVSAGFVGLALSYALSVTSLLSGLVTAFTETEKEMVSVERADQYIRGVEEEPRTGDTLPPFGWPFSGVVRFVDVCLRYREGLPLALRGVSFECSAGAKVGVVGRTGAGKSSLLRALFRVAPLESGHIYVDGVDISGVDPHHVRSRLAIIPQDPFVFTGSVRANVDPFDRYPDAQLWKALERCHVGSTVSALGGLEAPVGDCGRRLSVGQRQLLCLARALLYKTTVLCLDEATASIDSETDWAVQQTIRSAFWSTTVIIIAHRVQTVLNCDQILVMSDGRILESGSPSDLLRNERGHFCALVRASQKHGNRSELVEPSAASDDGGP